MRIPSALALAALAAVVPAAPATAQDPPPALEKPADPVRDAWGELAAIQEEIKAAGAAKDQARLGALRAAYTPAQGRFRDAFAKADWNSFDPASEKDLLGSGLVLVGRDALGREDGKTAVRAFGVILAKLPGSPFARAVGQSLQALPHLDLPVAIALAETCAADPDPGVSGSALVFLGDARCAQGDLSRAKFAWQKAAAAAVTGEKGDPAAGPKRDAEMRLALVGSPAPEIDSKTWLGGEAMPLSKLRGVVVVVDFWATWCPPCRKVMPGLNEVYGKRRKDGLAVIGVTKVYPSGFMPRKGTKEPLSDGEQVPRIAEADFPAHLAQFRENVGIDYPFVTAGEADFKNYRVVGIPSMFVLDREGRVAFIKVGSGDETFLHMTLDRLLAAPAADTTAPPK